MDGLCGGAIVDDSFKCAFETLLVGLCGGSFTVESVKGAFELLLADGLCRAGGVGRGLSTCRWVGAEDVDDLTVFGME